MWVILIINVIIASIAIIAGFNNRAEAFSLFNAGVVFVAFWHCLTFRRNSGLSQF